MSKPSQLALALALVACGSAGHSAAVDGPSSNNGSDAAGRDASGSDAALVGDPANDGPYTYTTTDNVTIPAGATRSAVATTFVPTTSPSPRPLVFVSPGFQLGRAQYTSYAQHLATWGMTVVVADYTDTGFFPDHQQLADDVGIEITWALAQASLGIDSTKIATAGHSLGGKISMLVAVDDARVKAVVGWDPVDGGSAPTVTPLMTSMTAKVAVIGETTDGSGGVGGMACAPTADNYKTFYTAAPSPALEMNVPTADHMDWVDDPSCLVCSLCTAGSAPASLARTATQRLNVAWLREQLDGDSAMAPWLSTPPEVGQGTATVVEK